MALKTIDFETFRAANVTRANKWHQKGIGSWSPAEWMTALMGEVGELASLLKMRQRERDGLKGNKFLVEDKMVADELADIFTYLDLLAAVLSVNLGEAVVTKFNEVSARVGLPDRLEYLGWPKEGSTCGKTENTPETTVEAPPMDLGAWRLKFCEILSKFAPTLRAVDVSFAANQWSFEAASRTSPHRAVLSVFNGLPKPADSPETTPEVKKPKLHDQKLQTWYKELGELLRSGYGLTVIAADKIITNFTAYDAEMMTPREAASIWDGLRKIKQAKEDRRGKWELQFCIAASRLAPEFSNRQLAQVAVDQELMAKSPQQAAEDWYKSRASS